MTVQFLQIGSEKVAVMPVADYERLLELAEDNADAASAAAAQTRRLEGEEYLPADMVDRILGGESALHVWREYRGLTLEALGSKAGLSRGYLSELERGLKKGNPAQWRALADALAVLVDDILPE